MSFNEAYLLLIFFIIAVDYITVNKMASAVSAKSKKSYFVTAMLVNILTLIFFKYVTFLFSNFNGLFKLFQLNYSFRQFDILLPIGISFYIFKSISYIIESYRGNIKTGINLYSLASYVLFFPEILAGPIDRPQTLIPQFQEPKNYNYTDLNKGIKYFAWGLFLKTVISDRLAVLVDKVYSAPSDYSGPHLIIATVFFAFQIYTDFAGYSYIAIGAGRILGFNLMQNFNHPYFSESVSEFWSRWHISLSTWLRDYLFLPISYSMARRFQKIKLKKKINIRVDILSYIAGISLTMFIGGLWHGAGWNFIIWGLIIAFYLICSVITSRYRKKLRRKTGIGQMAFLPYLRMIFIFGLMCIAWIFFRAANVNEALYVLTHLFTGLGNVSLSGTYFQNEWNQSRIGLNGLDLFVSVFLILILILIEFLQLRNKFTLFLLIKPRIIKAILFAIFLFIILLLGNFSSEQFIYFQF
jgi:alginate O-acetyltransferase complex protein AlgI